MTVDWRPEIWQNTFGAEEEGRWWHWAEVLYPASLTTFKPGDSQENDTFLEPFSILLIMRRIFREDTNMQLSDFV